MAPNAIRKITILILSATLIAASISAATLDSKYELVGLGMHEETGRKIYLGGLYLPKGTSKPQDLMQLTGPMLMEYRVVARRTSIRSLLGGMLLQSEVATGQAPGTATSLLADMVLSNIKTSLYTGDSLMIQSTQGGETVALLNNHELARVEDTEVARYLLMGWVSENGPSALFRRDLMATETDPSMLSMLESNSYSAERETQVAAWFTAETDEDTPPAEIAQAPQSEVAPTAESETTIETPKAVDEAPSSAAPVAVAVAAGALATESAGDTASISTDSPSAKPAVAASIEAAPQPAETSQAVQTAALTPIAQEPQEDDEVLSLGVQEYSRRLSEFHGNVVAMVYREIRYPKRAVRRNLQGRLELDLSLQNNGELVAVNISQSSGHNLLDNAALDAAKKAFKSGALDSIDPVAIAEFGGDADGMVIPIPVSFKLAE